MSTGPLLITSFRPWRSHQRSNASDDLISILVKSGQLPTNTVWLRRLPVHFQLASIRVISEIQRRQPCAVICCGMAERRACLSIERQAKGTPEDTCRTLQTTTDIANLMTNTVLSEISDDAGSYVCNRLYYDVLKFIDASHRTTASIFVHVPILSKENQPFIRRDFINVVEKIRR